MKIKNVKLMALNGQVLRFGPGPDDEIITTAKMLQNAALAQPVDQTVPRDPKEIIERYEFAKAMQAVDIDETFDIDFDFYQKIRPDMTRVFNVMAAGQVLMQVEKQ